MKAELVFSPKAKLDETDLARRIEFLQEHGISSFIIANTDKKDREVMPRWIEVLNKIGRESTTNQVQICAQYSLKHHPALKGDVLGKKEDFLQTLKETYFGANEILLVPGSYAFAHHRRHRGLAKTQIFFPQQMIVVTSETAKSEGKLICFFRVL